MSYFSLNLSGTASGTSISSYSGTGSITIGSTASSWYSNLSTNLYSSSINYSYIEYQSQIDSLKELINLLLVINSINIDIDEFIQMDKDERIVAIRDIKIKKILPHESK